MIFIDPVIDPDDLPTRDTLLGNHCITDRVRDDNHALERARHETIDQEVPWPLELADVALAGNYVPYPSQLRYERGIAVRFLMKGLHDIDLAPSNILGELSRSVQRIR